MKPIQVAHKAEKKRVKLKLGVQGPSGSGKTKGALYLVKNLWPDAKVLLVDTENESASLYADEFSFDTIPLEPPFGSDRYEACIDYAVREKYDVLILDTISHQWEGEGGILRRKDEMDRRPNSNSYMNWNHFTPEHTHFIECIKQAPIHIIATMRSKQEYALENNNGKIKPVKMGLGPIQRDGTDYEFSIVFDVQMDHKCTLSKNRTSLFGDRVLDLKDKSVADELRAWLDSGKAVEQPQEWSSAAVRSTSDVNQQSAPQAVEFTGITESFKFPAKEGSRVGHLKLKSTAEGKESFQVFVVANPVLVKILTGSEGESIKISGVLQDHEGKKYWQLITVLQKGKYDFTTPEGVAAWQRDTAEPVKTSSSTASPKEPPPPKEPPKVEPVQVKEEVGRGKSKKVVTVTQYDLEGIVIANSGPRESSNKAICVTIGIDYLPDYRANPKSQHNRFDCYHKSLHQALANAKVGSVIKFRYFSDTQKDGKVVQYIESVQAIDDLRFDAEGNVIVQETPAEKETIAPETPEKETISPVGLFN